MKQKEYTRIDYKERVIIETLIKENRTLTAIAEVLGRNKSSIYREVGKYAGSNKADYKADQAHFCSMNELKLKRSNSKIDLSSKLKRQIYRGLIQGLSPEQISGRLEKVFPGNKAMHVSHETIYKHIYEYPQGRVNKKLIKLLTRGQTRRRKKQKRAKRLTSIKNGISIEFRPEEIMERLEAGHWEGDLVVGAGQKSFIGTLVERKTRYTIIIKLESKLSEHVCREFIKRLKEMPNIFLKSMTYDNGSEMAAHQRITEKTGMSVYFAHPYSSWERGTNENTNGLIRRVYPKGTDFRNVTAKDLKALENKLNSRPRKILGFYTPEEMMEFELLKIAHSDDNDTVLKTGNKSPSDLFSFLMPVAG